MICEGDILDFSLEVGELNCGHLTAQIGLLYYFNLMV
jgi:hypothetical protein